jgi:hypothetical protein
MFGYRSFTDLDNWYALGLGHSFDPHLGSPFGFRLAGQLCRAF